MLEQLAPPTPVTATVFPAALAPESVNEPLTTLLGSGVFVAVGVGVSVTAEATFTPNDTKNNVVTSNVFFIFMLLYAAI